jgi:hypothetical protein
MAISLKPWSGIKKFDWCRELFGLASRLAQILQ